MVRHRGTYFVHNAIMSELDREVLLRVLLAVFTFSFVLVACEGPMGPQGEQGKQGASGRVGPTGTNGTAGPTRA